MKDTAERYDFTIPLYEIRVSVYISHDMAYNIIDINNDFGITVEKGKFQAKAMQIGNSNEVRFAILLQEHNDLVKVIAHESLHLSWYICGALGIELSLNNHEPQAYILEYIVDKINSFLI